MTLFTAFKKKNCPAYIHFCLIISDFCPTCPLFGHLFPWRVLALSKVFSLISILSYVETCRESFNLPGTMNDLDCFFDGIENSELVKNTFEKCTDTFSTDVGDQEQICGYVMVGKIENWFIGWIAVSD